MNLKDKINNDFNIAFKERNIFKKNILGMIKTKLVSTEKRFETIRELTQDEVIDVLIKYEKEVNDLITSIKGKDAHVVALDEAIKELEIVSEYLPKKMNDEDMKAIFMPLLNNFPVGTNRNKIIGSIMTMFKNTYNNYNSLTLKELIEQNLS